MKSIILLSSLLLSLTAFSQSKQYEETYVKNALDKSKLENCAVIASKLKSKSGIHVKISSDKKPATGIILAADTRSDSTLAGDGNGSLEYTQERFMRAWGPFMYQGMRRYKMKLKLKEGIVESFKFTAWNLDFPYNRYTSFTCK